MANHTEGPWILETVKTQVGVCHKIGKLGSSTKLTHACLYDDCYSVVPRDLQLLADAHLISAAPDLLTALRHADLFLLQSSDKSEERHELLNEIEAAIQKAEARP